jgi:DNA-binding transcriptional ArsR family regulator
MQQAQAVFRAIADPTRREILSLLAGEDMSVGEVADSFEMTRPAVSQHLRVLRDADLLSVREEGTRNFYRTRLDGLSGLRAWLNSFWDEALDRLKEEAEKEARS